MSKSDKFFQFPVSALRMNCNPLDVEWLRAKTRLNAILNYCIVEVGRSHIQKGDEDAIERTIEDSRWTPAGTLTKHQRAVIVGLAVLNVSFENDDASVSRNECADDHKVIESSASGSKILRIRADLFWNYWKQENDWTWREFSICCGLYAGIGAKPSAQLSYQYISALAAGYSRIADMPEHYGMPMHIVRHTVRKLEGRSLVYSLCANGRHTHYSKSLDHSTLASQLVLKETKRLQTEKSKALESLRQQMADLKPKPTNKPPKPQGRDSQRISHSQSNGKPHNGTHVSDERQTEIARQEVLRALGGQNDN